MKEIDIKQVFLCMFLCKLEYIKMPHILQLRPRILVMSASRVFTFWPLFSRGTDYEILDLHLFRRDDNLVKKSGNNVSIKMLKYHK